MKTLKWMPVWLAMAAFWPPSPSLGAVAASAQTLMLGYQEVGYVLASSGWSNIRQSPAFDREPDIGGRAVARGVFAFGPDSTKGLPFLWDYSQKRLYVDLNRNRDLTDDATGVFASTNTNQDSQVFRDVRFSFRTASGPRQLFADVTLARNGDTTRAALNLRSFWQGKLVLDGSECQVGLVEVIPGADWGNRHRYLLLRPWAERGAAITLQTGTPDPVDFPARLFWRDHAFQLAGEFVPEGGNEGYRLQLSEQQPELGQLSLSGSMIHRVILENTNGYTAVLDSPGPVARLPIGSYRVAEVWLKSGTNLAVATPGSVLGVQAKTVARLAVGGPLTNSVNLSRRGKELEIAYALAGAGGTVFALQNQDRSRPPEYTIYRGARKVTTGKFVFG